ncbi:MAG TPA: GGDEF domain-containing protein, partial [Psychromonas hadalis]|nr:GGDEF domain-containing protein [Psychromonas hadalis]
MFNRHAFDTELSKHLKSSNKGLSLILGDIDHFKAFNDKWGHFLGDQVLKSVGKRFIQNMRNGATDFRFGGEEFAILIPNSNFLFARNFAETLRRSFEKSPL